MNPEWSWTIISAVAVAMAGWSFLDAWGDLRSLQGARNGRRTIARGYMRDELIRLLITGSWLALGIDRLTTPGESSWSLGVFVLVAGNGALAVQSILAARDRLKVRRMLHPPPT